MNPNQIFKFYTCTEGFMNLLNPIINFIIAYIFSLLKYSICLKLNESTEGIS